MTNIANRCARTTRAARSRASLRQARGPMPIRSSSTTTSRAACNALPRIWRREAGRRAGSTSCSARTSLACSKRCGMMRIGSLVLLLLALASCAHAPSEPVAPADGTLHYQVLATVAAGGELTADVTITLPATFPEGDFILGRRFALQPIETSPHADVRVEPTDEPLGGLHGIHVRFDAAPKRSVTVRFRYSGPIFASEKQDRLGYT